MTLYKNIQIRVSKSGQVTGKYFIKVLKFWVFLQQNLSLNFVSQNFSSVLTLYKNTQTRVPESGHDTVKHFTEIVEFKMFLKTTPSHIFLS